MNLIIINKGMRTECLRGDRLSPRKRWKEKPNFGVFRKRAICLYIKMVFDGVDSRFGYELATKWQSLWEGQSGYLMPIDTVRSLASRRA